MLEAAYQGSTILRLSDGEICCRRFGQGPAVAFLHGIPLSLLTWRRNLEELARRFTVLALDLKGFGRSAKGPGDYSPQGHARILGQVLETLELRRTSLVGSSYGCLPAVCFALSHPEKVERLVLINCVAYGGRHSLERLLRIGVLAAILKSSLRARALGRWLFASRLRQSYASPETATDALIDSYMHQLRQGSGEESFLATLRSLDSEELTGRLPQIRHPTLILWGGRDRILPPKNGRRLQRDIPGSRLEILDDCGHLPHEEAPARVNALIREFLEQASSLPGAVEADQAVGA